MTAQVTRKQMRTVFADTVVESLDADPRVVMLTADISSWFFWEAKKEHPDRVLNLGIRGGRIAAPVAVKFDVARGRK